MTATHIAFAAAAGATSLALMTTLLAWRMRARFLGREDQLRAALAARDAAVGELDSAINAYDETVLAIDGEQARLVWNEDALIACGKAMGLNAPTAAGLLAALAERSPDAATALRDLVTQGRACRVEVFAEGATLIIDGRPSGATAWVRVALGGGAGVSLTSGPFALMAEQLPAPCWIVGRDGQLLWANKAWLAATEADTLLTARDSNLSLDKSAETLVQDAATQNMRKEAFRWIAVAGRRRAFRLVAEPLIDGAVAAYALDVTEVEETQDALRRHVKAHDETLDRLADAVAIFGPEKRLAFHNRAFESLWALDAAWLSERPAHGELLDRLRQKRKLPETIDYSAWKLRELSFYSLTESAADEIWSLPDGRSLRVVRQPHPLGGLLLLFSDITGELRLKAQYNSLIQVQRATLDQLYDAVAVFGADGRLRLRNAAFARFWGLDPATLFEAMDFEDLARDCQRLLNDTGYWQDLKARITDPNPEARVGASGEMRLADKRIMTWRTQPLPDGATLVAFLDITATRALEDAVEARERALSESVRLK
ncbi:MAG: PAS-domain containing protein, partial [Asticcacaulis sp.]